MAKKQQWKIYPPSEDTFLLIETINQIKKTFKVAVEIGTGYGLVAIELASKSMYVVATDLNEEAILTARDNSEKAGLREKMDFIVGDLLSFLKDRVKIDVVAFNPPYVPEENLVDDISWYGGSDGRRAIDKFLDQVKRIELHMILLVQSTLSEPEKTKKKLRFIGYNLKTKRMPEFFEEIILIKAVKDDSNLNRYDQAL